MVTKNLKLDLAKIKKAQGKGDAARANTPHDQWSTGTVVEALDNGLVAVELDGTDDDWPPVVAPADPGVTAIGASVRVIRDSTGRVSHVAAPDVLPDGANPLYVGSTGQFVKDVADAQVELDEAMGELDTRVSTAESDIATNRELADQAVSDATASLIKANAAATGVYQEFAVSASPTTIPSSGWSASTPAWVPGAYIWSRTVTTKGDGTTVTGSPVLTTGNDGPAGDPGADGKRGEQGPAGNGVDSTAVAYQASASGTTTPTGAWSATIPTVSAGQYLWTRTVLTYTNGSTATLYSTARQGANGAPGQDGTPGSPGTPGTPGVGVASVTPYFLMVTTGANAPAKPTVNPPGGAWSSTEPAYVANTELYRTDRVVYTNSTFAYTNVSKVAAYKAAREAITVANLAAAAAAGMIKPSQTDPGHQEGRLWFQLDSQGRTVGIKISDGQSWSSYALMADQVLVPGSAGTTSIKDGAITTPKIFAGAVDATKITASESLWAKIGVFAEITTQMLVAGGATITGELLADVITLASRLVAGDPNGSRTELDQTGLHVYQGSTEKVQVSASAKNGLRIWDSNSSQLVDLADAAFGSMLLTSLGKLSMVAGATGKWGAWVGENFSTPFISPTSRCVMYMRCPIGDVGVAQNFYVRGAVILLDSAGNQFPVIDTGAAVTGASTLLPNGAIPQMGVNTNLTPGATYTVRAQFQASKAPSGVGTPWVSDRNIVVQPI